MWFSVITIALLLLLMYRQQKLSADLKDVQVVVRKIQAAVSPTQPISTQVEGLHSVTDTVRTRTPEG
jgi:hypothetical protein